MLSFRPHHFLCTIGFQGKGYSEPFIENFVKLATKLNSEQGDSILIRVVDEADVICNPCPNRRDKSCLTQKKIAVLDTAHAKVLGLQAGDVLSWGEAKARIRERMSLQDFHASCAPCAWKQLGVCEQALIKLLE